MVVSEKKVDNCGILVNLVLTSELLLVYDYPNYVHTFTCLHVNTVAWLLQNILSSILERLKL